MQLAEALELGPREIVAFVGAGGKTSALYCLARELLALGRKVIATTTTHALPPPAGSGWPLVVTSDPQARLQAVAGAMAEHGRVFVAAAVDPSGKLVGISPGEVEGLAVLAEVTLIEADGARGRWLKAPAEHEPVIPEQATLVVPVVGLQAVGQPLAARVVHRPERLASLLHAPLGGKITEGLLAALLRHSQGGLRGAPPLARVVPLCNQAETPERRAAGRRVAAAVLGASERIQRVVLGGAQASEPGFEHWEPSAVVVLAAGAGQRYGKLKQAQEWEGKPFLSRVVAAALSSLATSVLVVLGCQAERLASLLAEYSSPRLQQTVNRRWQEGLASSIRAGLDTVDSAVQTVVFCGADQPLLSAAEIDALLIRHAATAAPVVAPRYAGQFRSPVLFARRLFPDLAALAGDVGGRAVLDRYGGEAETIEILDPMPYEDVDTPADYLRLRRSADDGHKR